MPRKFPPLPAKVDAPLAPFRVVLKRMPVPSNPDEEDDGEYGFWSELTREMRLNADHPRWQQWQSYFHEHTHIALSDSGLDETLSKKQMEAVCDCIATARFRERFGERFG